MRESEPDYWDIISYMDKKKTTSKNESLTLTSACSMASVAMLCVLKVISIDPNGIASTELRQFYIGLFMSFAVWAVLTLIGKKTVTLVLAPAVGMMAYANTVLEYAGLRWLEISQLIVAFVLVMLIGIYYTLDAFGKTGKIVTIMTRFLWILFVLYFIVAISFGQSSLVSKLAYGFFAVSTLLITMPCTMKPLAIFAPMARYVFWIPAAMALTIAGISLSSRVYDSLLLDIASVLVFIVAAVGSVCFGLWVTGEQGKGVRSDFKFRITAVLMVLLVSSVSCFFFFKARESDLKYRQERAEEAFREQVLRRSIYNWGEIMGMTDKYSAHDLEFYIAYIDPEGIPVLFLNNPKLASESGGFNRIVFFDESTGKVHQVWGDQYCVYIDGYYCSGKTGEYPIIVCSGGAKDISREFIYQIIDGNLVLLASYEVPDPASYPDAESTYMWKDAPVTSTEYNDLRGALIGQLETFEWIRNF